MQSLAKNVYRERIDFSKIRTVVPIPNLIEIQKRSYERFLQMNRLPAEREDVGLQSVFKSVFPISDFRENSSLEFIEYSIGNWECKCSRLVGLQHLRKPCVHCGATLVLEPYGEREVLCTRCGKANEARGDVCDICGHTVGLKLKYDMEECQERGMTYAVPLKVTIRLVVWNKDPETGVKTIRDIKEQEVYFGDIPLMTDNGTFIINGTERVIVSQLHRSPGRLLPQRGEDALHRPAHPVSRVVGRVRVRHQEPAVRPHRPQAEVPRDRVPARPRACAATTRSSASFYTVDRVFLRPEGNRLGDGREPGRPARRQGDADSRDRARHPEGQEGPARSHRRAPQGRRRRALEIDETELQGAYHGRRHRRPGDGRGDPRGQRGADAARGRDGAGEARRAHRRVLPGARRDRVGARRSRSRRTRSSRTKRRSSRSTGGCGRAIRRRSTARASLFENMFFNPQKYDFSRVGRLKLNTKLKLNTPLDEKVLHPQDFYEVIKYLLKLRKNPANVDDIDHLGNRRVRSVGELLENQFRIGLVRMERAIKEKMSVYQEMATAMPHDLINAKPVMAAIREFFGSSQLSQFMDQTNPLSEVTHKRRLSALGPGGLSRERAGFEVRDVHPTHYGRICPIETPEGPNIGLISSLSCYARINEFGFIESPYRKVKNGRVVDYVMVTNTAGHAKYKVGDVVEADDVVNEVGKTQEEGARVRAVSVLPVGLGRRPVHHRAGQRARGREGRAARRARERAPGRQLHPRAAGLDPVHRRLAEAARVGGGLAHPVPRERRREPRADGIEHAAPGRAAAAGERALRRHRHGVHHGPRLGRGRRGAAVRARVDYVDSQRIVVRVEGETGDIANEMGADIYKLTKFKRSNQNTCISQKPIVRVGQRVQKGQVLADGPCTESGELALGRNVLVAFMPWRGYNFEDAILVSEKLVREDYYTSIHIEEFEIEARDTKLGPEEITRDIPNVSEGYLRDLDESGIIRIGAYVKPGDILVGKVTPKGETQLTPEEKLLRAIFGEKAGDVKDASLLCPPGIEGIVVGVRIFSRKGIEKDDRAKTIEAEELEMMEKNLQDEIRILHEEVKKRVLQDLAGRTLRTDLFDEQGRDRVLPQGHARSPRTSCATSRSRCSSARRSPTTTSASRRSSAGIEELTERRIEVKRQEFEEQKEKIRRGDELPPGVIKLVKVYVAMKRKLSVGDKMAGRHGNKGVIARILPEEDMPHLPDGTPVEIVLNPLGVPSRMNVGQILETHLGWAAHALGLYFATPGLRRRDRERDQEVAGGGRAAADRARRGSSTA